MNKVEPGWLYASLERAKVENAAHLVSQERPAAVLEALKLFDAIRAAFPGIKVLEISLPHADNPSPTIYPLIFKS